jgi:hypothetical protein
MRERLRNRAQWIVITSPEAATASLASTLEGLAVNAHLRYFVIDEAHIVSAWGGAFRPAFQGLAGLRRRLTERAAAAGTNFTTSLLTGTLDQHGYQLLGKFFSEGEPTVVLAQATRPEPSYWAAGVDDDAQKREVVVDALRHLPRPAIIYTSLVAGVTAPNAHDVHRWLRAAGFNRLAIVTGDTSADGRRAVIAGLRCSAERSSDLDIVVASSAFGLGVDIEHVRSVVHICVPESIDRYYQEVGRGGRDGRASVSLVVHAPNDVRVAERLSSPGNIRANTAWMRWVAMRRGARVQPGRLVVSLRSAHPGIVVAAGDLNEDWNLHTLTVMELAGMIRLHWTPEAEVSDDADVEELQAYFDDLYHEVEVEVLHGDIDDEAVFRGRFERARGSGGDAATVGLDRVRAVIAGPGRCHNAVFAEAYRVTVPNRDVVVPERRCGGCPDCRARRLPPWTGDGSSLEPYVRARLRPAPLRLAPLLGQGRVGGVTYTSPPQDSDQELESLLRRSADAGSQLLVTPLGIEQLASRVEGSANTWVARDSLVAWLARERAQPLVTTVVLPSDLDPIDVAQVLRHAEDVPALILVHHARQPSVPGSKLLLRERVEPSTDLTSALRKI